MARRNRGLTDRGTRKAFPRSRKVSKLTPTPYKYSPSSQAVAARIYGPQTTSTNPSTGGGGNPKAPRYPGYLTPAQIAAAARADANLQYGMDAREFRLLRDEELKRAAKRAQAIQGFTTAAAQMMQGAGPAVQGAYQSAAKDQSAFAKGFSDATAHVASQTADTANQRLSALGNTGTPVQGDTGAADVLYGLGGYIPATTMEREGAGFAAQAAAYPQATLGEGAIAFRGALQQGEDAAKGYDARLKSLAIQKGMTVSQLIRQARREQTSLSIQARNEKIQARNAQADAFYKNANLQLQQHAARIAELQYQRGVTRDELTAKRLDAQIANEQRSYVTAQKKLTLQYATISGTLPNGDPTYAASNAAANRAAKIEAARIAAAAKKQAAREKAVATSKVARGKAVAARNKTVTKVYQNVASEAKKLADAAKPDASGDALSAILGAEAPKKAAAWDYGKASAYLFNKYWPQLAPYSGSAAGTKQLQTKLRKKIRSSLAIVGIRPKKR